VINTADLNQAVDKLNLDIARANGFNSVEEWTQSGGVPLGHWVK